jgi:polysaccharide export outer membrane protein
MRIWPLFLPALALWACSSLPHDGPSGRTFGKADQPASAKGYSLVDLSYADAERIAAMPPPALAGLAAAASTLPNDRLGEGDVVDVAIYEPGGMTSFTSTGEARADGGSSQSVPRLTIDKSGCVPIPFAGPVHIQGMTVTEAAEAIKAALRGRAVNPQVQVNLVGNFTNSVTVMGEVRSVGRVPLTPYNERLLDVLAVAGGPTKPPADITVTLVRGDTQASAPFTALLRRSDENVRLAPHDQIRLLYAPRKYSVFGALGRVNESPIEDEGLTLAEAISRAGGLDTMTANAASVLVFRFERPTVARALGLTAPATPKGVPVVYRLNMLQPVSFFIANSFAIQPNDLIYVPRSDSTELRKFLELVSLVSQVTYNLTVTPVLK